MQVTVLLNLQCVHAVGGIISVIIKVFESTFDSDLPGEMANSWCIELDPSPDVAAIVWLHDDVGAQVLRKRRVVSLGVSGFI